MLNRNIALVIILFIPFVSAKVTYGVTPISNCSGSISIGYEDDKGNVSTVTLDGVRRNYPNIRIGYPVIRDGIVSYMEVLGNCCWKIFSKRKFDGETQIIYPTEDIFYVSFQPVSLKRILECV